MILIEIVWFLYISLLPIIVIYSAIKKRKNESNKDNIQ